MVFIYPSNKSHNLPKACIWKFKLYSSLKNIGSYLTTTFSLPSIELNFFTASIIKCLSITFGSILFYYKKEPT